MVSRKLQIKPIKSATAMQEVSFPKRRRGLLKKAHELAVLCDAEVGVIIFSNEGKLFQFASPSMHGVLKRFWSKSRAPYHECNQENHPRLHDSKTDRLTQYCEESKTFQSNDIGANLKNLSLKEIICLEQQLHESLGRVHAKKEQLLLSELEDITVKVAAEVQMARNVKSKVLEKLGDSCPSEGASSQHSS